MEDGGYIHVKKLDHFDFLTLICKVYDVKKYMKRGMGVAYMTKKKKITSNLHLKLIVAQYKTFFRIDLS